MNHEIYPTMSRDISLRMVGIENHLPHSLHVRYCEIFDSSLACEIFHHNSHRLML